MCSTTIRRHKLSTTLDADFLATQSCLLQHYHINEKVISKAIAVFLAFWHLKLSQFRAYHQLISGEDGLRSIPEEMRRFSGGQLFLFLLVESVGCCFMMLFDIYIDTHIYVYIVNAVATQPKTQGKVPCHTTTLLRPHSFLYAPLKALSPQRLLYGRPRPPKTVAQTYGSTGKTRIPPSAAPMGCPEPVFSAEVRRLAKLS